VSDSPAASISFRPLGEHDLPLLAAWLSAPHVARWWREPADAASLQRSYAPILAGDDPTQVCVAELDGAPLGLAQRYRFADNPDWCAALAAAAPPADAAGIDYLIGVEALTGRGLGSALVASFVTETWSAYPEVSALVVDVAVGNRRSWRTLERVGFTRVWTGPIDSGHPSDAGLNHVYLLPRPV
jgi:aminoglycoside 6'-N-acetyltransferase